ncbi:MAG: GNAT family N-acetyltransferase [Candidatus ainarchaeum sp.]|nr:GNAT family N-acetyltransferase [Candidatus ainarchaeum sp.]
MAEECKKEIIEQVIQKPIAPSSKVEYSPLKECNLNEIAELNRLFPHWKRASVLEKIKSTCAGKDYRFAAKKNGQIVAHVKVVRNKSIHSHTAFMTSLFVLVEERRQGIGLNLMKYAIEHLSEKIKFITFAVDKREKSTINLCKKLGFKRYGELKHASIVNGKYVDNYLMVKQLQKL